MKRFAVLLAALTAVAGALPAGAQMPAPSTHPHSAFVHKAKPMTFTNPAGNKNNPQGGAACMTGRGANAAAQTVNPTTGKPQAATIVSIPLNKGGGSVASATTRAQQNQACAHTH